MREHNSRRRGEQLWVTTIDERDPKRASEHES